AVDVEEAHARTRPLARDVPAELFDQVAQQRDLLFVARREVGVPALGGDGAVALPVPEDAGHPQYRAGGDEGAMAGAPALAFVQGVQLLRLQALDAVSGRFQIVDESDALDADSAGELLCIHDPREIRRLDAPAD